MTIAIWSVSLDCYCPACKEYVNLLDYTDFWDGREIDVPECGTERSRDVEVKCPKCDHEFIVDLVY